MIIIHSEKEEERSIIAKLDYSIVGECRLLYALLINGNYACLRDPFYPPRPIVHNETCVEARDLWVSNHEIVAIVPSDRRNRLDNIKCATIERACEEFDGGKRLGSL